MIRRARRLASPFEYRVPVVRYCIPRNKQLGDDQVDVQLCLVHLDGKSKFLFNFSPQTTQVTIDSLYHRLGSHNPNLEVVHPVVASVASRKERVPVRLKVCSCIVLWKIASPEPP